MFGSQQQSTPQQQVFGSPSNNNFMQAPPQSYPNNNQQQNQAIVPQSSSLNAADFFGAINQTQNAFGGSSNNSNNQNAQTGFTFGSTGNASSNNQTSKPSFGNANQNNQFSFGNQSNFNNQAPNNNFNNQSFGSSSNNQQGGNFGFGNNPQTSSNSNSGALTPNSQPQPAKPTNNNNGNLFSNVTQPNQTSNQLPNVDTYNRPQNIFPNSSNNQPQNLFSSNPNNNNQPQNLFSFNNNNNNQPQNLFSSNNQQPQSLFGNSNNNSSSGGLFNNSQQNGNLFANQQQSGGLFNSQQPFNMYNMFNPPAMNYETYINYINRTQQFNVGYPPQLFGHPQPTFTFNCNVQPEFVFNHPSQRPRFVFNAPNQSPTFTFNNQHSNPTFMFNQPSIFGAQPCFGTFGTGVQGGLFAPPAQPTSLFAQPSQPTSLFTQPAAQPQPNPPATTAVTTPSNQNNTVTLSGSQESLNRNSSNQNVTVARGFSLFGGSPSPQEQILKPKEKRQEEKKLAAIIVTLCNGQSFDNLFSTVQQKTLEGTQVMVYSVPSTLSKQLLAALNEDYSAIKQEYVESYKTLIKEMDEVQPECVVFNWQCCQGYQCEHFNNQKEIIFALVGQLLQRGHMVMFSDFSLKALINDWNPEVLGKCPFVRIGNVSSNVTLYFNPNQLKECPSAQLRLLGDLVESGECKINCASDTIRFSVDNDQIDLQRYNVEILTIMQTEGTSLFTPNTHQIGEKEGVTGHVLLTYKSGGTLLASMSHWTELSRITPSEQKFFQVAEREYGATFANNMRNQFGSLPASERTNFLSSNAVNFVQNQAPCSNMNRLSK